MGDAVLTPERILQAAEDVLRRFGPEKATVVDVARRSASRTGVYRHFAARRRTRWSRWLSHPRGRGAETARPAVRPGGRASGRPTTRAFATYSAAPRREVVRAHGAGQAARIIADGGPVATATPAATGVLHATTRFHTRPRRGRPHRRRAGSNQAEGGARECTTYGEDVGPAFSGRPRSHERGDRDATRREAGGHHRREFGDRPGDGAAGEGRGGVRHHRREVRGPAATGGREPGILVRGRLGQDADGSAAMRRRRHGRGRVDPVAVRR